MDHIYPDQRIVSDRTIDSHVKKLRKKIAAISPEAAIIKSLYGAGYKFEPTAA
jgi:two-component system response regulator BaeR